jgi:hypothetical protein
MPLHICGFIVRKLAIHPGNQSSARTTPRARSMHGLAEGCQRLRAYHLGMSRIRRSDPETSDRSLTADVLVREEPDEEEDEQDEEDDDNEEDDDEGYSE